MTDQMSKQRLEAFQSDLTLAMAQIAAKHGMTARWAAGTFSTTGATLKIDLALTNPADPNAPPTGKDADAFRANAFFYGLAPSDLGRTFRSQGINHRIIGLKPRATRREILTQADNGMRYVFSAKTVVALLHQLAA